MTTRSEGLAAVKCVAFVAGSSGARDDECVEKLY